MHPVEEASEATTELTLWDGRVLKLGDSHLTLFRPDGSIECRYPRNQVTECHSSPTTWDVFLRFWNNEEIALLATSGKDTERIVRWAAQAPRLQRRSNVQRAVRKAKARSRIISGGASFSIGLALLIFTYQVGKTTGYFLIPFGAIGFGGMRFFTGLVQYVSS